MSADELGTAFWRNVEAIVMPNQDRVALIYRDTTNPFRPRFILGDWPLQNPMLAMGRGPNIKWCTLEGSDDPDRYPYTEIDAPTDEEMDAWDFVWRAPEL
ncbi:MAG: hypothetical protein OXE87_01075 [Chloroflexi bacterium]|nr:hypothetical protein [Chloroflexota bacterium]